MPVAIRFPMSALDYGNGDKVQYSYDDKGRVLSAAYEGGDTLTRKAAPYILWNAQKHRS